jgi:hypothetical protein
MFVIQVHLYFKGLFMTKRELDNKANMTTLNTQKPKKVIMMLVDAMREDFV